ncbi:MAG: pantoate--beta-alanine ligase [Burkholderiales bacterium]
MEVLRTISALRERLKGETGVAFVPTMGNLHQGHLELMRIARQQAGCVVASLFVNRLQFGQGEDFDRYPRTFDEDCEKLGKAGIDVLFAPEESELYPVLQEVTVNLPPIAEELCGASRPGHFRGMATVVLKLFNIVRPDCAVFGKKDCQQLHLVRKMVSQLDLPISIVAGETVREADGLAMSSRNRYLTAAERLEAPRLHYNLEKVMRALVAGERDFRRLESEAQQDLANRGWKVDYLEVREAESLGKPGLSEKRLVVLGAAWLGKTRLIDNLEAS